MRLLAVDKNDMWILLMSTIRYSMGRRTYMSSLAGELVIKYRNYLTKDQLTQIVGEIRKELELVENSGCFLGDGVDHEAWKKTVSAIERLIK